MEFGNINLIKPTFRKLAGSLSVVLSELLEIDFIKLIYSLPIFSRKDIFNETFSFTVSVRDLTDDSIDPINYEVEIQAFNGTEATLSVDWTPDTSGDHNISVKLDSGNDVDEYDDDNNDNEYTVSIGERFPELGINNGTYSFEQEDDWLVEIFEFHNNTLSFDVNNFDHHEEVDNATVNVYVTLEGGSEILLYNFTDIRVPSGTLEENSTVAIPGSTSLNFIWNPDLFGNYHFR